MTTTTPNPRHPRWRFEFRLRSLFLFTAIVACPLGYIMYERHRCHQQQRANTLWMSKPMHSHSEPGEFRMYLGEMVEDPSISVRSGWSATLLGDNSGDQIVSFRRYFDNDADRSITHRQMHAFAHLPNLKVLEMRDCDVEHPGFNHLAAFHKLESLSLPGSSVTDKDLRHLGGLSHLTTLSLNNTKIGDSGIVHLAKLAKLKHLDLHQTQIGDEGVKHLSLLTKLQYLDLSDTRVTEKSLDLLAELKSLNLLALPPDSISPKARAEIRKRLPHCDCIFVKN